MRSILVLLSFVLIPLVAVADRIEMVGKSESGGAEAQIIVVSDEIAGTARTADADAPYSGPVKGFDQNGKLNFSGYYQSGQAHGEWRYYWEDESLMNISIWQMGEQTGPTSSYDPSGYLVVEGMLVDGAYHGERRYYWEDGTLQRLETYDHDTLHGPVKDYYPDGMMETETVYVDGRPGPLSRTYHPNGALATEVTRQDDMATIRSYDEDGTFLEEVSRPLNRFGR